MAWQLSSHYVQAPTGPGKVEFTVTSHKADHVRHAVVSAVMYARVLSTTPPIPDVALVIPTGASDETLDAVCTMASCVSTPTVHIFEAGADGGAPTPLTPRQVNLGTERRVGRWAGQLGRRDRAKLPQVGVALAQALQADRVFRWYRNVTGAYWSGRVMGWEVVRIEDGVDTASFGETQADRDAGPRYAATDVATLAADVRAFAVDRSNRTHGRGTHKREHMLEAGVWRGPEVVEVQLPSTEAVLQPLVPLRDPPLQMPAMFGHGGSTRFIDVLMHLGTTAYVNELKTASAGQGQAYLSAITQAVLYREFLRMATPLHPWLCARLGLAEADSPTIQGVVTIPRVQIRGDGASAHHLAGLRTTARAFGVEVVELDDWATLHRQCGI